MKYRDGVIVGCLLLCGFGASPLAQACTTDGWSDVIGLGTTLFVGSPTSSEPNKTSRWSEFCAMRVTGEGSVRDLSPDHSRIRVRFYVRSQLSGSGTVVLFRAYPNETDTGALLEIRRSDASLVFDTTVAGGATTSVPFPTGWSSIEFDWQSGDTMKIWVNADAVTAAPTTTVVSGSGTISSVRLGAIAGLGGFTGSLAFDAYEAHSTTAVGLLRGGDTNGNGVINSGDTVGIINEFLGDVLAVGQPDCNRDGNVNSSDTVCIINAWLGS